LKFFTSNNEIGNTEPFPNK